eukprot:5069867-Pyramimonas_sp.AAC.1
MLSQPLSSPAWADPELGWATDCGPPFEPKWLRGDHCIVVAFMIARVTRMVVACMVACAPACVFARALA